MFRTLATECRAAWRLTRLALHLLRGLLMLRFHFPRMAETQRRHVKQRWSARLLACLGVRLHADALEMPTAAVLVCNHVSWLDIFVINALTQTHFVCKDEVRHWPVIGWLVERSGTLFIERGNRAAAARTAQMLGETIRAGDRVAFFPEGTTTDGHSLLPFKTALFQSAVDSAAPVIPLTLRYRDGRGTPSRAAAYDGDISFWECLRTIARAPDLRAHVQQLEPLPSGLGRRELAEQAWARIADDLGLAHSLTAEGFQSQPLGATH